LHGLFDLGDVSTADQNPDHQIDALLRAGVDRDNIHVDKASGAKASRPKLDLVMQLLREGDTLKVTRLDRLSRSVLHLVTLGAELRERDIGLHVIEQGIDTATMEGRAMFGMLSMHQRRARLRAGPRPSRRTTAQAHPRPGRARPELYDAWELWAGFGHTAAPGPGSGLTSFACIGSPQWAQRRSTPLTSPHA
jgi:hypothetical protein